MKNLNTIYVTAILCALKISITRKYHRTNGSRNPPLEFTLRFAPSDDYWKNSSEQVNKSSFFVFSSLDKTVQICVAIKPSFEFPLSLSLSLHPLILRAQTPGHYNICPSVYQFLSGLATSVLSIRQTPTLIEPNRNCMTTSSGNLVSDNIESVKTRYLSVCQCYNDEKGRWLLQSQILQRNIMPKKWKCIWKSTFHHGIIIIRLVLD